MMDSYRLNPYASVAEVEDGFLVCGSTRLQVRFPKHMDIFLGLLASGRLLPAADLRRYISDNRIEEMRRKHILLSESVPPVAGRYSRQLGFFSLISEDYRLYHDRIAGADILLLGGGAIGTHVLWNLAAMGVGKITLIDFDAVEESNLNRQLWFSEEDIGHPKVEVLARKAMEFNRSIVVTPVNQRISRREDVEKWISGKSLVIKAIDTPEESTEWVNSVCVEHKVPYITGGFLDDLGVVGPVYIPEKTVCTACVAPQWIKRRYGTGATFAPLTGIVSSRISMCIFRMLAGITDPITNKLFIYNTLADSWESVDLRVAQTCSVCGRGPEKPPARKAPAGRSAVWDYRAAMIILMLLVGALTGVTRDRYAGLVMLAALILSMPALDLVCRTEPEETCWQIFLISCVYCLQRLAIVMFQGGLPFAAKPSDSLFGGIFSFLEQVSAAVIELALTIACLCILLYGCMYAVKTASGERQKWMS